MNKFFFISACLPFLFSPLHAEEYDYDLRNGKEVNEICAGCHGEFGQGGKDGEYPRLAGQPMSYLLKQMQLYREKKLDNMAMLEYVNPRDFPEDEMYDVTGYLSQIELLLHLPPIDESKKFDPLERLQMAKMVLNIPRTEEGDPEQGRLIYNKECRSCHGVDGWGKKTDGEVPMLAGQYTQYLLRAVDKYRKGIRTHDEDDPEELLNLFSDEEIMHILAFLATVDDME